ncbi:hypothetical protein Msi02_20560 [Microbispora siamensis]|uniref:Secreted protein n=1 Tax=Microbispora siamensis TaxID=564413 RepID=A0ABQ4GIK7_9ACTN|nr:hypothetical protein Msi02_20560 [Microbispora siamensis]
MARSNGSGRSFMVSTTTSTVAFGLVILSRLPDGLGMWLSERDLVMRRSRRVHPATLVVVTCVFRRIGDARACPARHVEAP